MSRHPEAWQYWREHPERSVDCAIELMRYIAMSTTLPRIAAADFEWPLTFGPGLHHCIGHLLAKLQMSEFFGELVRNFDRVEILEEPTFTSALVFRSVNALNLRFHPRASS